MQNRLTWNTVTDHQLQKLKLPSSQDVAIWKLIQQKGNHLAKARFDKIKFNDSTYFILQLKNRKQFLLGKLLGKGGYGVVYAAIDADTLEIRAIKMMHDMPSYKVNAKLNYLKYDFKSTDLVALEKFADTSGIDYIVALNIPDEILLPNTYDKAINTTYTIIDAPYLPGNTLNKYFLMPLHLLRNDAAKAFLLSADHFKCKHKKDRFSDIELLLLARNLLLEMEKFHRNQFVMVDVRDNNFILNPQELTITACDFGGIVFENLSAGMWPNNFYLDDPNKQLNFFNPITDKRNQWNVYSIGVIIGMMFEYIELMDSKNHDVPTKSLLEQRYQLNPENVHEFIRAPLVGLIEKMLILNKEIRPSVSQCIDSLTQIIIDFCQSHPECIKANKSGNSVVWKQLNEFLPNRESKSTPETIVAMLTPLYENWESKSDHDKKVASAETRKVIVHELSNCEPEKRAKIAQELRHYSIFAKHVNRGITAIGRTDRQIVLDSYIHSKTF